MFGTKVCGIRETPAAVSPKLQSGVSLENSVESIGICILISPLSLLVSSVSSDGIAPMKCMCGMLKASAVRSAGLQWGW